MSAYKQLASLYSVLGLGLFARDLMPRLFTFIQQDGWMGRYIVDLGCGAGDSSLWIAKHQYIVTGIDASPEMLAQAEQTFGSQVLAFTGQQGDIRNKLNVSDADLVVAISVFNEIESLNDFQTVIQNAHAVLKPHQLFVFDLHTIEGLIELKNPSVRLIQDQKAHLLLAQTDYDYDRQILTLHYTSFRSTAESLYRRENMTLVLRGYPVLAIAQLLQRNGFDVRHVLKPNLDKVEVGKTSASRVIFVAQKR